MSSPVDGGSVLLTGASSGIGRELALQLGPRARRLILVARRTDRLLALKAELTATTPTLEVVVRGVDLEDRAQVVAFAEEAAGPLGPVDVLINNAGFGVHGRLDESEPARLEGMIAVNVVALTLLTRALVTGMLARKRGAILNISSSSGLVALPGFAAYCGTKHYVTAFTDGLAGELAGSGVHVTQSCPGPVRTEFSEVAGFDEGRLPLDLAWLDAATCARQSIAALDRNRPLVIPGWLMTASMWAGTLLPRWVYRVVGARLLAQPKASPRPA